MTTAEATQNTNQTESLATVKELSFMLKIGERTIRDWIKKDLIPYISLPGGEFRIPLGACLYSMPSHGVEPYVLASKLDPSKPNLTSEEVEDILDNL